MRTNRLNRILAFVLTCLMLLTTSTVAFADSTVGVTFTNGEKIMARDYFKSSKSFSKSGTYDGGKNLAIGFSIGHYAAYSVVAPQPGIYALDLQYRNITGKNFSIRSYFLDSNSSTEDPITNGPVNISISNGNSSSWNFDEDVMWYSQSYDGAALGYAKFPTTDERKLYLRTVSGNDGPWVGGFKLTYVEPVAYETVKAGDIDLSAGDATVPMSTDSVKLVYADGLDSSKLGDVEVTLTDEDGTEYPAYAASLSGSKDNELNIAFAKALIGGKTYSLSVDKVTDKFGYPLVGMETEPIDVTFAVAADDDAETKTATITADSVTVSGIDFEIKGTYKGSLGKGVEGRNVKALVTSPKTETTDETASVVTEEDGKFTINYQIPEGKLEENGMYEITFAGDYVKTADSTSAKYISKNEELRVLSQLEAKTTADEIEEFLSDEDNLNVLALDLSVLDEFADKSLFYKRLADAEYKNDDDEYSLPVFDKVWNISFAMEEINQADSDAVTKKYLEDESFAKEAGLNVEQYNVLDVQKADFISAVTALNRQETIKAFGDKCNELLNDHLLIEKEKSDISLTLTGASVYVNQDAIVDIALNEKVTDISGYTLTVVCENEIAAKALTLEAPEGASVDKKVRNEEAIFTVSGMVDEEKVGFESLGKLVYSSTVDTVRKFTVSGDAVYTFDDIVLTGDISSAEFEVRVSINKSQSSSGSTSSFNSSFSGGGSSKPVVKPDDTEATNPVGAGFNDLDSVAWAQDSIEYLYKKGIISEAADGKFRPNDSVTRAEFVKMLVTALRITDTSAPVKLSDVSQSDWYYTYVSSAVNYGLVLGDDKGNFRPNDKITRQDICVIISRAMDKLGYSNASNGALFTDDAQISDYAKSAVYRMRAHEIVNGTGDGSFAPLSDATRAATAKMIEQFMKEAKI